MEPQISLNPQLHRLNPPKVRHRPPIRRRITAPNTTAQKRGKPPKLPDERPLPPKRKFWQWRKPKASQNPKWWSILCIKRLQMDGDLHYGAMLRPVIQDQIHKDIQSYSNRNANINFQALYAAEQNRLLSIHILRFLTDLVERI